MPELTDNEQQHASNRKYASVLAVAGTLILSGCSARTSAGSSAAPFRSDGYPIIYSLVARDRTLIVTKGPTSPLYCVKDSAGTVLMRPCTLDQVAQNNPELYRWVNAAMAASASVDVGG